jgi:predicted ATPase
MPSISIPVNRSFPLKKIFLRNFKSVKDAEVPISPLTVVVGANSSGKSTLLQSVLSLSQAMSKELNGTIYPLNGEIIRLGSFAEARSFFAESSDAAIRIGFELETEYLSGRRSSREGFRVDYRIKTEFEIVSSGSENSGTAQVSRILIDSKGDDNTPGDSSFLMNANLVFNSDILNRDGRRSRASSECTGTVNDLSNNKIYSVDFSKFSGLMPASLWERKDTAVLLADQIIKAVEEFLARELKNERGKLKNLLMSGQELKSFEDNAVEIVCRIFEDLVNNNYSGFDDDEEEIVFYSFDESLTFEHGVQKLSPQQKKILANLVAISSRDQIVSALERASSLPFKTGERTARQIGGGIGVSLEDISQIVRNFARNKIKYLGPIRLVPKVNYDPSSGRPDVGSSGEFTAYVLHVLGQEKFQLPLPSGVREYVSLNEAVNLWLDSFGLASNAKTAENGRLGIGLRLNLLSGGNEVDLTSVGVGVSQVLPVIVSCLIAKKGTVLLLEQPELHLHPKLQMDLADFLIACSKSGRQIIVETHSEHMVSRIRRRIAESTGSELEDLVGILFAEQKNGVTQYRSPSINKFGGLGSDWPDGFLDVGAGEMENLLVAGLAKRKKK